MTVYQKIASLILRVEALEALHAEFLPDQEEPKTPAVTPTRWATCPDNETKVAFSYDTKTADDILALMSSMTDCSWTRGSLAVALKKEPETIGWALTALYRQRLVRRALIGQYHYKLA